MRQVDTIRMNNREKQLLTCIPDVLDYESLLYIGAADYRQETLGLFIKKGYDYTILEIWEPNVEWLRKRFKNVVKGDVRDVSSLGLGLFDVVMWWHGPEHVKENEITPILDKLKRMTKKVLVTANPWGIYESGLQRGNPHESHLSYLYPGFFKKLGWQTNSIGKKDVKGSNLLAWQKQ